MLIDSFKVACLGLGAVCWANHASYAQTAQTMTPQNTQIEKLAPRGTLPAATFISRQESGEMRAANLIGVGVTNKAGESVGDIVDVVLKPDGKAAALILGVGGMLGLGEKNVAVPYDAVAIATDKDGKRSATIDAQKSALEAAPVYVSERTTFEKVQDGVSKMATSAKEKAIELKEQMSKPDPAPAAKSAP